VQRSQHTGDHGTGLKSDYDPFARA